MDDFNQAAAKNEAYSEATKKIMEGITKTRLSIALYDATVKQDWAKAGELIDKGADPMHRSRVAIIEVAKHDTVEAQRLLEKMKVGSYYTDLKDASFVLAAKNGNLATVEDTLTRSVSAKSMSRAVHAALMAGQDSIADLLLKKIKPEDLTEKALFALLVKRPGEFEKATAGRTEKHNLPDFIGYLYHAASIPDHDAMSRALTKMIEHKESLSLYKISGDYDGAPYGDYFFHLLKTGDQTIVNRFIDNFNKELPYRSSILAISSNLSKEQPTALPFIIAKLKFTPDEIGAAISNVLSKEKPEVAQYFVDNWKEQVKANPTPVLVALAAAEDGAGFIKAVTQDGIALPSKEEDRARILGAALEKGSEQAKDWLRKNVAITPDVLKYLQLSTDYTVQKQAAALGGTMRFNNDSLFWNALQQNDRDAIAAFPREEISTATPWRVGYALEEVIKRNDMGLLKDVLAHAKWDEDSRRQVFRTALKSQEALEATAEAGLLPKELKESDLHDIVKNGGPKMMDWLENHGLAFTPELVKEALRLAVHKSSPAMIEHLMAKGVDPANGIVSFISAIDYGADEPTMAAIEKWRMRGEKTSEPSLAETIAQTNDLFSGVDSVAVRAAYADGFAAVMKKAAAAPDFDPQLLLSTKDSHGNTVLEILGAHGKLGDILEPASVWKNRDAVAFIETNTPKPYHAKIDYHGLKAALDLLKLQEGAKNKRFKLG